VELFEKFKTRQKNSMSSDDDGCQWDQSLEQEVKRLEAGAFCLRRITQTHSLSLPEALRAGK
jgi:hypothetical protein